MKNLWNSRAFKIARKGLFICISIYIVAVTARSFHSFGLSNGDMLVENVSDFKKYYYFTFGHVKEKEAIKLDENNVYYVDYSKIKALGVSDQLVYNPVTLALNAIRSYQKWLRLDNQDEKVIFLANANWLVENINDRGEWPLELDVSVGEYLV
ncbi:MAG: hypothetical protein ACJAV7_002978, partial [Flavobacteriales bacterium]